MLEEPWKSVAGSTATLGTGAAVDSATRLGLAFSNVRKRTQNTTACFKTKYKPIKPNFNKGTHTDQQHMAKCSHNSALSKIVVVCRNEQSQ